MIEDSLVRSQLPATRRKTLSIYEQLHPLTATTLGPAAARHVTAGAPAITVTPAAFVQVRRQAEEDGDEEDDGGCNQQVLPPVSNRRLLCNTTSAVPRPAHTHSLTDRQTDRQTTLLGL